ncbi:ATP-dependent Lon protease [Bradyrhizobium sp. USDA 4524]|uniref:endopeptidase La n=1 Tax=unclassified Bradyrhizobium TaxID=2631580 RepID=UPI00209FEFC0|nr:MULTISPECIES: endopeptidase La [unclassified Bradyrhizobium]MCP1831042.1 ATP-dependent Lon protease [Bradyrhizobium sp. USDA 4545]MCP1842484.1 ATP-dependent Lon protease [Bradyrhizobium sp. USDA 4538]MCP1903048.1 ATP-dependent Lon protease [Bradyrhizobium sp. USDA 4537]MCP1924151.1 ATP-dependent Lon protease [Bradyrhizobium sp. USDA 4532]MCP1991295.1 ATP-dependent Lon protease [Bradyrhizobium sp. USDA 4539]
MAASDVSSPASTSTPIPSDALIIVPVRNTVLFPDVIIPITIARATSIAAAQQAVREQRPIGILLQRDPETNDPGPDGLYRVGTTANIVRYITGADDSHHLVCQGVQRMRVLDYLPGTPFLAARVLQIPEPTTTSAEIEARFLNLQRQALEAAQLLPQVPQELIAALQGTTSPATLADLATSYMDIKPSEKQDILETIDLVARMDKVSRHLAERIEVLRLSQEIGQKTKAVFDERQREAILREQMATIQRQLGEGDGKAAEVAELTKAIVEAKMPPEAESQAQKELRRYERMPEAAAESGMVRSYLDWLIDLPWSIPEEKPIDIAEARKILDQDHYGLEKIKSRIIEYLAVRKLAPGGKAPILCFLGPPGVGKTSLGQSIARAMARPFVRVSLGGVHDEAEIRGHRRTYIGALPGNIIQAIKKAGARNCVMMLDEIDKMGRGIQGDPSAAMLEVLDPEQNSTFRDNYLGVPFDLSRVVFIATANMLDGVPGPLLDRMELISLAGYTEDEKLEIAKRYLVRRQLEANGIKAEQVEIDPDALRLIIRSYTREAGVRNLEREIGKVLRNVAVQIAEGSTSHVTIAPKDIVSLLGQPRFENEIAMRTSIPGVATGLAWTPVGGDILFIEASRTPGRGALILTGQLGEVMRESVQAALTLVKSRASQLGIDPGVFEKSDIHVHVPAGATPKDGPSAGVAMFTALTSLLTDRTVRSDTAMTGEISLRGLVLPVGGIKEKVVAAAAAGLTRVMLPARNKRDFDDIPAGARAKLEFIWLERVDEAIAAALEAAKTTPAAAE